MPDDKGQGRRAIIGDLMILQLKLALDGIKGVMLSQGAILAAFAEMFVPRRHRGRMFYTVLAWGEKFDLWLNLYGAAQRASDRGVGLFSVSRAGANSLLGTLEEIVRGPEDSAAPGKAANPGATRR